MDEGRLDTLLDLVARVAKRNGIASAFHIGGYPRAVVMRAPASDVNDLDIATASMGKATQFAGLIAEEAGEAKYETLHRTGTVRLYIQGEELDFQGPMVKDETMPYLREAGIEATPLAVNIYGRDFTINALAIPILRRNTVIDLTKRGVNDINEGVIASIIPPEDAIPGNPLMITRAVRFARKYDFRIKDDLWDAMKKNIDVLRDVKPERLAIEAFSLSKYDTKEMLDDLGLGFLTSREKVREGMLAAEE
jgi:poly(A) polymerase